MKYMPLNGRLIFKWKKTFMLTSYRSTFRDVVELKDGSFLIYVSDVVKSDNNDDECNSCIKYDIFIKLNSYGNFISESKMVSNIWGNSYMVGTSKDGDIYIYGADVDKRNGFEGTKFIINKLNIDIFIYLQEMVYRY